MHSQLAVSRKYTQCPVRGDFLCIYCNGLRDRRFGKNEINRNFNRLVPPPEVPIAPDSGGFYHRRSSSFKTGGEKPGVNDLAWPRFGPSNAVWCPERTVRSVYPTRGRTRDSVTRCCAMDSVPGVLATGLVDLRPHLLAGRLIHLLERWRDLRRRFLFHTKPSWGNGCES